MEIFIKIQISKHYKIVLTNRWIYSNIHKSREIAYVCVAQLDRALGYGPRCREFESSHARLETRFS